MPKVGNKKFPYTKAGKKAAMKAKKQKARMYTAKGGMMRANKAMRQKMGF